MGGRGGVSPPSGSRTRRPAHSAAPAAPLGKGGGREDTVTPGRDPAPASPRLPRLSGRPHTVGLQVHLVLILVLPQLDLLRVGLLCQLGQLLPGGVAPAGRQGSGRARALGLPGTSPVEEPLAPVAPCLPHKQDLALRPWRLVTLGLGRQLLRPLLQQLHVIHATLPRGQVGHWGGGGCSAQRVPPSPQLHPTARSAPAAATGCPKRSEDPALKECPVCSGNAPNAPSRQIQAGQGAEARPPGPGRGEG